MFKQSYILFLENHKDCGNQCTIWTCPKGAWKSYQPLITVRSSNHVIILGSLKNGYSLTMLMFSYCHASVVPVILAFQLHESHEAVCQGLEVLHILWSYIEYNLIMPFSQQVNMILWKWESGVKECASSQSNIYQHFEFPILKKYLTALPFEHLFGSNLV